MPRLSVLHSKQKLYHFPFFSIAFTLFLRYDYLIQITKQGELPMKDCNCGYCMGGEILAGFGIKI